MKYLSTSFLSENSCQPAGLIELGFGLKSSARNENCRPIAHGPTLTSNTEVDYRVLNFLLMGLFSKWYLAKEVILASAIEFLHISLQRVQFLSHVTLS